MSIMRSRQASMPTDVQRFERRVEFITTMQKQLPARLKVLLAPLRGPMSRLMYASHQAASGPSGSPAAIRRHESVCRNGGYALVNGA